MGSSMAENHPVGFQWVDRGAREERRDDHSRRSALQPHVGDGRLWVPLRAGSDIVFLGALINYVLAERARLPRVRRPLHERRDDPARGLPRHRGSRRAVLRMGRGEAAVRPESWLYEGAEPTGQSSETTSSGGRARQGPRRRSAARLIGADRDETLQHPRCVFQVLKRHFARYTPEMVEQCCGIPQERVPRSRRHLHRAPRDPRRPARSATRSGWTQHSIGRADHPRRGDPATAARQHRPSRRRHHGAARPRVDPGIDRHPDAVRHPARLPADAEFESGDALARRRTSRQHGRRTGWWYNIDKYIVSLLKAYYGDAATRGERLRLRLAAAPDRRSLALRLLAGHGGRQARRAVRHGPEPRGRRAERAARAAGAGETEMAGRARYGRDRDGERSGTTRRRSSAANCAPRTSRPRCSSFPPRRTSRRTGRSRTRSGCCSGARRRSSRPATRAASCGSSFTSGGC